MKKLLTLALIVAPAFAFAAFPDVKDTHPFAESIQFVKDAGIVSGYPDGSFKPDKTVNRAEFAKMFAESKFQKSQILACNTTIYTLHDVPKEAWFAPYVCVLMEEGLVRGYDDETYRPDQEINFAEAAKILTKKDLPKAMQSEPNPWFKHYVSQLGDMGAIPLQMKAFDQKLTRGMFAEMLFRLDLAKNNKTPKPSLTYRQMAGEEPTVDGEAAAKSAQYVEYSEELYAQAIDSGRPFMINFSAAWCPNCLALDKKIQAEIDSLPPGALIMKANYDTETELKEQYGVTQQTTGVFFDASGDYKETVPAVTLEDVMERL